MIDLLSYGAFFLTTALTYSLICLGLNLQWGQTGLFNVGVAGFVAVGAYASALLTTPDAPDRLGGLGLPIVVGWLGAGVAAAAVSAAVGALTLRLRADYLAITTFGVAVAIHLVALNAVPLTGGPFGVGFIPRPFAEFAATPGLFGAVNLAVVGAVVLAVFLALERLVASPWGRALRALREDETAAASLGKDPTRLRLQAFAIGGAAMGLAGALQAHFVGFVAPDNFQPTLTFQVWTMLIVGGSGNNRGAIVGGVVVWGLWALSSTLVGALVPPEHQARAAALQIVAIGIMLAAVLVFRPRGLIGETRTVSRHLRARPTPPEGTAST